MRRLLLPLTVLLALVLAAPAGASRTPVADVRGAARSHDAVQPRGALTEINSFGVRSLRVILTWQSVAPGGRQRGAPGLRADRSRRLRLGRVRAADGRDQGARLVGAHDDLRAGAAVGDAVQARQPHAAEPVGVRGVRHRGRPQVRRPGRHVGDLERAQPAAVPAPAVRQRRPATSPAIYRNLYLAGVRGLRKSGQGDDTILIAETSPRGNSNVVHPLRFMRAMLCLDAKYKKRSKCSALPADGYAHHAYTTRQGPFFTPPNKDDVTIGVLSRLTKALDRARSAGALTKRLPIYLTEFGIQSTPDLQQGVSLKQQVQYRAISERTAWNNPRVIAFSQYLLTDSDADRTESVRRLRVGAALLRRQAEAVAGRLPAPARGQADRLEGLDLGPRAAGDRRHARRRSRTPTAAAPSRRCARSRPTRAATSRSARRGARAGAGTSPGRASPARPSSPTRRGKVSAPGSAAARCR